MDEAVDERFNPPFYVYVHKVEKSPSDIPSKWQMKTRGQTINSIDGLLTIIGYEAAGEDTRAIFEVIFTSFQGLKWLDPSVTDLIGVLILRTICWIPAFAG